MPDRILIHGRFLIRQVLALNAMPWPDSINLTAGLTYFGTRADREYGLSFKRLAQRANRSNCWQLACDRSI